MKYFLSLIIALSSIGSFAASVERRLFTMEKNHNAENIMIIHTQTDENCKFITSPKNNEKNYLEFYWSMNGGTQVKEVHNMIRAEIKKRVSFQSMNNTRDSFKVRLNDLTELNHDLPDTIMEVSSEFVNSKCKVKSILNLGASGNHKKMDLKRTYCEVTTNFVGIPNGCKFLDLHGVDADAGAGLKVRFKSK